MRDLVICHAPEDRPFVRELGAFLERGASIRMNPPEGELRPGETMIEAVERGVSADLVIALLSPDSVPREWPLKKWTEAFINEPKRLGVPVACVTIAECKFPELLRRHDFFECGEDSLDTFRAIKRWLIAAPGPLPPAATGLDDLRRDLADKPGSARVAAGLTRVFVSRFAPDFERVATADCGTRSWLNLVSEIGGRVGASLSGPFEQTVEAVKAALETARVLLALEGLQHLDLVTDLLGSRCSLLYSAAAAPKHADPDSVLGRLKTWRANLPEGLVALGEAETAFEAAAWPVAAEIGRLAFVIANDQGRLAEADYWADKLLLTAWKHKDYPMVLECQRQRRWIHEGWGTTPSKMDDAVSGGEGSQLDLFAPPPRPASLFEE